MLSSDNSLVRPDFDVRQWHGIMIKILVEIVVGIVVKIVVRMMEKCAGPERVLGKKGIWSMGPTNYSQC
jgi:hypothetical protein